MNKKTLNKILRRFGFEIHGTGYLQSISKTSFKEDAFVCQKNILGNSCKIIFDAGANRGDTSLRYLELFPKASIFAFEPFPASFEILNLRLAKEKNVFGFQKAVGEKSGRETLFINKNVDTNSLLKSGKIGLSSDRQVANISGINVQVCTLDEFCGENNINFIDILKLDIQGGELAALKGAKNLLSEKKIKLIYSETYFRQQYEEQPLFHDISKYLEQFGYAIQDFYNPIYGKNSLAWCDVIFLAKEI